jgi:hypothetical protein
VRGALGVIAGAVGEVLRAATGARLSVASPPSRADKKAARKSLGGEGKALEGGAAALLTTSVAARRAAAMLPLVELYAAPSQASAATPATTPSSALAATLAAALPKGGAATPLRLPSEDVDARAALSAALVSELVGAAAAPSRLAPALTAALLLADTTLRDFRALAPVATLLAGAARGSLLAALPPLAIATGVVGAGEGVEGEGAAASLLAAVEAALPRGAALAAVLRASLGRPDAADAAPAASADAADGKKGKRRRSDAGASPAPAAAAAAAPTPALPPRALLERAVGN